MRRFFLYVTHKRALLISAAILLFIALFAIAIALDIAPIWPALLCALIIAPWAIIRVRRHLRARRAARRLSAMLGDAPNEVVPHGTAQHLELADMRTRLLESLKTIRTSKIGQFSGKGALYAMPWYLMIGNPASGKSSAILNCGLPFPFANKDDIKIGEATATRNCDWIFTTEGLLLDTAGRYGTRDEDRSEWHGLLKLLKRHRPRTPVNGVIIVASVAELSAHGPEFAARLARTLRERVQDIIEKLAVMAPVYVLFSKADLIPGFHEFFKHVDTRELIWGATFPFDTTTPQDAEALFDTHFDQLHAGLDTLVVTHLRTDANVESTLGQLNFPREFLHCKAALRAFVAALFESNPFQHKPSMRGFYFSSALRDGSVGTNLAARIAEQFDLDANTSNAHASDARPSPFFLRELFARVIMKDTRLAHAHDTPVRTRSRRAIFFACASLLAILLSGWTWSALNNQQLIQSVHADLDRAANLQRTRGDLRSAFEAMNLLETRITQLEQLRRARPLSVSLGLYQGERLERQMIGEYFDGVRQIMLDPAMESLVTYLKAVNANPAQLAPSTEANTPAPRREGLIYDDASPSSVTDAYNALKTYLMLGDRSHVDTAQLSGQLPRFWRSWLESHRGAMPREDMIRNAERMIGFYLAHASDPRWPTITTDIALVDQTRSNLRHVVRDMPVRQRVYEEIKARASTRFAPVTVARIVGSDDASVVAGSYAVPGAFTRDAWFQYVQSAILSAATHELQARDWVLNTSSSDDLTLEGSPEDVQKALIAMYMAEYAQHWRAFMQGVTVPRFANFDAALAGMNRLGDPQHSPLRKVLATAYEQTSWDTPSRVDSGMRQARNRARDWFGKWFLHDNDPSAARGAFMGSPGGPVGQEFAGFAQIMRERDGAPTLVRAYLEHLSKVRTRFTLLRNEGNPGPGARQLMQQTLDGNGSELADALRFIDDQMLTGLNDAQRGTLRPALVRPLMQAYAAIIVPAGAEVDRVWNAQVYQPFQATLSNRYPFAGDAKVEASASDIAQIFGPDGAISRFAGATLGPLAVRRGSTLTPRTWADMGVALSPAFTEGFARWVAPLAGGAASSAGAQSQTVFQVRPQAASNVTEYTLTIDGQQLRYRNTPPQWSNFVWPNPGGAPGVTLSATTFDGRTVQLVDEPGRYGLEKLINSATRKRLPDGAFELSWTREGQTVSIELRIVSTSQPTGGSDAPQQQGLRGVRLPASVIGQPDAASAVATQAAR